MRSLLIIVLLILLSPVTFAATSFRDIRSPILSEAVSYLQQKNVISGYPDGTFRPEKPIIRAEALKMIFLSQGTSFEEKPHRNPFPDVSKNAWHAPYIDQAKKTALVKGYPDGKFRPQKTMNRAEFVKIAMLAQTFYTSPTIENLALNQYADLSEKSWYLPYLSFGLEYGFLDKTKAFKPDLSMTRADAAIIIARLLEYRENLPDTAQNMTNPALISCETCIRGVNLGKEFPELAFHPLTEFKDGKIFVYGTDRSALAFTKTDVADVIQWAEFQHLKETTPEKEKIRVVNEQYPEEYQKILKIYGGVQDVATSLATSSYVPLLNNPIRNGAGVEFFECRKDESCWVEDRIVDRYNWYREKGTALNMTFDEYRRTDKAKADLFDIIKTHEYEENLVRD